MKNKRMRRIWFLRSIGVSLFFVFYATANLSWAAEKTKLRFTTYRTSKPIMAAYQKIIKDFEAKYQDYTIQIEPISWKDQRTYIIGAIASHTEPDIIGLTNVPVFHYAKLGKIEPLDDVIDEIGRNNFYPGILEAGTYKGHLWGVPWSTTGTCFWYRKDLFDEKGLRPPKTWEELLKCAKELTQDRDSDGKIDVYGIIVPYGRNVWTNNYFLSFLWSNGGYIFDKNLKPRLDSSKAVETLNYLKELAKFSPPGSSSYSYKETLMTFVLGKAAMTYYYGRALSTIKKRNPGIMDKIGSFRIKRDKYVSWIAIENLVLMKASKHKDIAKKFIKFYMTHPAYMDILHSVPGHYWSPLKTVGESEIFLSHPLFKEHQDIIKAVGAGNSDGNYDPTEHIGVPNPYQDIIVNTAITQDVVQKVLLKGESPKDALAWGQKKMEETMVGIEKME